MDEVIETNKRFGNIRFNETGISPGEYEHCVFTGCDFTECNLSGLRFSECEFIGCNLSLAATVNTAFRDVKFISSKMLGLRFYQCNKVGLWIKFEDCILDDASFYQLKIKALSFTKCRLHRVDFSDAQIPGCIFSGSDLRDAKFENTKLEKANFSTAINYLIDPAKNQIRGASFSLHGLPGLLTQYDLNIED